MRSFYFHLFVLVPGSSYHHLYKCPVNARSINSGRLPMPVLWIALLPLFLTMAQESINEVHLTMTTPLCLLSKISEALSSLSPSPFPPSSFPAPMLSVFQLLPSTCSSQHLPEILGLHLSPSWAWVASHSSLEAFPDFQQQRRKGRGLLEWAVQVQYLLSNCNIRKVSPFSEPQFLGW